MGSQKAVELLDIVERVLPKMNVTREDGMLVAAFQGLLHSPIQEIPNLVLNPVPSCDCGLAPWKAAYHPLKWTELHERCFLAQNEKMPPPGNLLHTTCL